MCARYLYRSDEIIRIPGTWVKDGYVYRQEKSAFITIKILPPSLETGLFSALSLIDMNIIFGVNSGLYLSYKLLSYALPKFLTILLVWAYISVTYFHSSCQPVFPSLSFGWPSWKTLTDQLSYRICQFPYFHSTFWSVFLCFFLSLSLSEVLKGIWIQKSAFKTI